jgi:hypothetical protein
MLRRASLAFFLIALGLAVACGRQVTPSPTFGSLSGTLQIKFSVADSFDFTQFNYWMVFNTSGTGGEPYAPSLRQGNFKNFSYAFIVGAITGQQTVLPVLWQFYFIPATGQISHQQFNVNPATTNLQLNTDGTNTQFTLIFPRSQLALPPPTAPTPTASPVGTSKPTSSPTPAPTGATPGPTPVSSPTVSSQSTWCLNLFTTDNSTQFNVLDALGLGPTDQSFSSGCFDVNQPQDIVYQQPQELNPPPDASSQLASMEIINTP